MTKYRIPERYYDGFEIFLSLDSNEIEQLVAGLVSTPAGILPDQLSRDIYQKLKISNDNLDKLLIMIFSLCNAKNNSENEIEEFATEIFNALKQHETLNSKVTDTTQEKLIRILKSSSSFQLTARALELVREREKLILETRIMTDIRPIISEKKMLLGSVIIHNLKVKYREAGQTKEIHFALDSEDLKALKENIEQVENSTKIMVQNYSANDNMIFEI